MSIINLASVHENNALCADFSIEIAVVLYESDEQYPVDFELAWQWLGYSRKDNGKRILAKHFTEGKDYCIYLVSATAPNGGLTHKQNIFLTMDCFARLASLSRSISVVDVLQCLGIKVAMPSIETQTLSIIQKSFAHLKPIPQFLVNGYRIDLYFPEERVAVECDELHHNMTGIYDEERQDAIIKALGCKFIRFKPHSPNFNLGDVIYRLIVEFYHRNQES
ncbi:endonuclease domain-containing protein [Scytonema sp. PRP1]|uniref:endonuclease domain-containing protein n=1 Tax=Scytonema sp. PRP1 TaxID=3120513 RepID=UPI002FD79779